MAINAGDTTYYQAKRGIVQDGLVLNLDAAVDQSYPGNGTIWYDLEGSNSGTLTNGPTFDRGEGGNIFLDGTDDHITCPDSSATDPQTNFSFNIWAKLSALGRQHGLIEKYNWSLGLGNYGFRVLSSNKLAFYTVDGISYDTLLSSASLSQDIWYNLCVTQNHDTDTATIYINGIQDSQSTSFDIGPVNSTTTMKIGARGDDATHTLQGKVSCVQIYHKALSAAEVLQNYNATKGRFE